MLAPESIPEGISPFFNKPTGRGTVTENAAGPPDGARGDDVGLLYRRPPVLLVLAPREEGREDDRDEGLEEGREEAEREEGREEDRDEGRDIPATEDPLDDGRLSLLLPLPLIFCFLLLLRAASFCCFLFSRCAKKISAPRSRTSAAKCRESRFV